MPPATERAIQALCFLEAVAADATRRDSGPVLDDGLIGFAACLTLVTTAVCEEVERMASEQSDALSTEAA